MNEPPNRAREIPVLTEAVGQGPATPRVNLEAAQHAIVDETLKLADALLHQAMKEMEANLLERVLDRLKAQLPELVEKALREQVQGPGPTTRR